VILRFYNTPGGELRCRVTDAFTHDSWVLSDRSDVQFILSAIERSKLTGGGSAS